MAETLAPMLSGGAASYERPTNQGGSYFGAAGALLDFFGQATLPQVQEQREPTADERFSQAWRQAQEEAGIALDPSNPNYRTNMRGFAARFNQTYPEFASQVNAQLGLAGLDNTLTVPQQGAAGLEQAIMEFTTTPIGQVANVSALQAATRQDGTVDESLYGEMLTRAYQTELGMQAEFEQINRQSQTVTATENIRNTTSQNYWNAFKPAAENLVDQGFIALRDIVTQMRADPGGQATIPDELVQQFGLSSNIINQNNFIPFLTQYRTALQRTLRDTLYNRQDVDPSFLRPATEQWYNEVLAPVDALISAGSQGFETAASVLDNENALAEGQALRQIRVNEPGLYNAIVLESIAPQLSTTIMSTLTGLGLQESVSRYILNTLQADIPPDERTARNETLSAAEAEDARRVAEAALATGQLTGVPLQNALIDMFDNGERVQGSFYLGVGSWNDLIVNNVTSLDEQAEADPAFAGVMSDKFQSDLNQNIQQIRNEMNNYPGAVLNMTEDGQLFVTIDESILDGVVRGMGYTMENNPGQYVTEMETLRLVADTALSLRSITDFNTKVGTLGNLTSIGQTVLDAVAIENQNLIPTQGAGGEPSPGGGMSQSQSSPTSSFQLPPSVRSDQEFVDQVFLVSERLGVNPNDMLAIMSFETGGSFDPAQRNAAGSGATGLIQFMPSTAEGLGTTTEALANMTRAEQMRYVEQYFQPYAGRMNDISDMYMAVLWPAAVGQPDDYVLFSEGDGATYSQNAGLDTNGDGRITKAEAVAKVLNRAGGNYQVSANPTTPSLLAPSASVRPLARQETRPLSPPTRPQARSTSEAPMQSVRPQARPGQGASSQTVKDQRNRAIEVLTRGGFTKEELSALGIY